MKNLIALFFCVLLASQLCCSQLRKEPVTSLKPETVKSSGSFSNLSPDAKEIITPAYENEKIQVDLKDLQYKIEKGKKVSVLQTKTVFLNAETGDIIKPQATVKTFGVSTLTKN